MAQEFLSPNHIVTSEEFERDLENLLAERVRNSQSAAVEIWSALANVQWTKGNGRTVVEYPFSIAAGLVVQLGGNRAVEQYKTQAYPHGQVAGWIRDALAPRGWRFIPVKVPEGGFVTDFSQPLKSKLSARKRRDRTAG